MLAKEGAQSAETTNGTERTALSTLKAHVKTNKLLEVSRQMVEKGKLLEGQGTKRDQTLNEGNGREWRETCTPLSWDSHANGAKSYDSHSYDANNSQDSQSVADSHS